MVAAKVALKDITEETWSTDQQALRDPNEFFHIAEDLTNITLAQECMKNG
jgi:hypothetical protein